MVQITANELKTKGINNFEDLFDQEKEAVITVRGVEKYVIMDIDKYNSFREYELLAALNEVKNEVKNKEYVIESVEDHIKRIRK